MDIKGHEKISEQVYILMKACGISSYPVNFKELILKARVFDIEFETYESFERFSPNARAIIGSGDGAAVYYPEAGFHIIFYNHKAVPQGRINWTISHEIGHILLKHRVKSENNEREADYFAKLLLCHPLILESCGITDKDGIQKLCAVSQAAAENRERELLRGLGFAYNNWDKLTAQLFYNFTSRKKCVNCGGVSTGNGKYCPFCGSGLFERPTGIFLSVLPTIKILKCPVCENQDLSESNFCKICGLNLKNPCTRCNTKTDLTAGFCHVCGAKTELKAAINA